jgi:hypothetical protein
VRRRRGEIFATTLCVLLFETLAGGIVLFLGQMTQESPDSVFELGSLASVAVLGFVGILEFTLYAVPAVLGACVVACLVIPLVVLAGWAGCRIGGRESWWWVPVVTAGALWPVFVGGALVLGAGLPPTLAMWLVATAGLTIPALAARRLLLIGPRYLTGGAMFLRVAVGGPLAVLTTLALCVCGLWAGALYEPPVLTRAEVVGTWSDGKGGTLTLTADGEVMVTGVPEYPYHPGGCTGSGVWTLPSERGVWDQEVETDVEGCSYLGPWGVIGTEEHPKLFVHIGSPFSTKLYTLERTAPAP